MENLVEDNGICDCHYLLTMRLALQREVDSPFGINSIYDLGDWCAPWWRKPVSYADLDAFFESNGCGWLRQSIGIGSWRGDAGEDEKAARIIRASLEQHATIVATHTTMRGALMYLNEILPGNWREDEWPEHIEVSHESSRLKCRRYVPRVNSANKSSANPVDGI